MAFQDRSKFSGAFVRTCVSWNDRISKVESAIARMQRKSLNHVLLFLEFTDQGSPADQDQVASQ